MFSGSTYGHHVKRWLIGIGFLELVLAGIFVVAGLAIPFGEGLVLTAIILGVTGVILVLVGLRVGGSAAKTDRILASGITGTAAITGLRQTGMYLNEQPQVEMDLLVQLPGRAPYPAKRKEFVPLLLLSRLTSGMPLTVKVDPADPASLVIDWQAPAGMGAAPATGGVMAPAAPASGFAPPTPGSSMDESLSQVQAALASSGMPAATPFASPDQGDYTVEQLRAYLRQNGIQASAVIDKLADTGQTVGDERLFTMQVTLEMPGQAPRQLAPSAAMVPLTVADRVRLGMRVPVRVAADNPNMLMFEWDKLEGAPGAML
jgi:hypothetical protein